MQSDGALVETGSTSGNGFNNAVVKRETADLSPDFVFDSKGRLTEYGYEIEVRIPFKSLRFQPEREQSWGINVVRMVQHSGQEDSWTPARRARASFLAQSGRLAGLTDLRRGSCSTSTPSLTARTTGAPAAPAAGSYAGGRPELGGNVRWGVTNNLTLNGTANPDFSQVESDAQPVRLRSAHRAVLSEKRPFFLEGIEQFTTPNNLIYTRRIVQPVAAAKLTGKAFGHRPRTAHRGGRSRRAPRPAATIRSTTCSGSSGTWGRSRGSGVVYTDKIDGDDYNRVAGADARLVFGDVYSAPVPGRRQPHPSAAGSPRRRRSGRPGWRATAVPSAPATASPASREDFRAQSGFISAARRRTRQPRPQS